MFNYLKASTPFEISFAEYVPYVIKYGHSEKDEYLCFIIDLQEKEKIYININNNDNNNNNNNNNSGEK